MHQDLWKTPWMCALCGDFTCSFPLCWSLFSYSLNIRIRGSTDSPHPNRFEPSAVPHESELRKATDPWAWEAWDVFAPFVARCFFGVFCFFSPFFFSLLCLTVKNMFLNCFSLSLFPVEVSTGVNLGYMLDCTSDSKGGNDQNIYIL